MVNRADRLRGKIFELLRQTVDEQGMEAYIIGGFVRDIFLDRPSKDIDIVVVGSGIELAQAMQPKVSKRSKISIFKTFGTAQLIYGDTELEFVGARRESYSADSRKPSVESGSLEDDQNRRDFTINAMALSLQSHNFGDLIDPFGGMEDLRSRTIRTPLDPDITFSDDPLRMMRAIRFATQLGFMIDPVTFEAITRNNQRIDIISKERVADELNKIMMSHTPSIGFVLLDESGLLELIFPELKRLQGVETVAGRGHKDNFYHTLQVVDNVARKSDNLWLRWAALLHDIAKPAVKRWEDKIGWTFHNHNYIGSRMVGRIFRNMKLPMNEKMKFVTKMVDLHMRPIALVEDVVTDSAVRRLLFDAGEDIEQLMILCEADITSKNSDKVRRFMDNFALVRHKMIEIEQKDRVRNFQPPISGDDIMRLYALKPCREVGLLKQKIKDAIMDGVIPNEYDPAFALLQQYAAEMNFKLVQ